MCVVNLKERRGAKTNKRQTWEERRTTGHTLINLSVVDIVLPFVHWFPGFTCSEPKWAVLAGSFLAPVIVIAPVVTMAAAAAAAAADGVAIPLLHDLVLISPEVSAAEACPAEGARATSGTTISEAWKRTFRALVRVSRGGSVEHSAYRHGLLFTGSPYPAGPCPPHAHDAAAHGCVG